MAFSFSAQSHPGIRREDNEDSYCARPDLGLFAVADGLGGHVAGQVASHVAIDAIEAFLGGALSLEECARAGVAGPSADADGADRLRDAFLVANARIGLRVADSPELQGMATTLAAVMIDTPSNGAAGREAGGPSNGRPAAIVAHIGDSRVYRWSGRGLDRLTVDHSWVEEQVQAGLMTSSEAHTHPMRNLVTRAIAGDGHVDVDLSHVPLEAGDRLLICSDGLSSVLADTEIEQVLAETADDTVACKSLVHAANLAGGPDNITVVLITV
jgi:serine/threonine protein phosphatase PrpC